MKTWLRRLASGAAFLAAAAALPASALPLPDDARSRLDSILALPEYQPRSHAGWSELIGRMIDSVWRMLKGIVADVLDWLFGGSPGQGQFLLPNWVASLFAYLGIALHVAIIAAIVYLLYRIIRPLLGSNARRSKDPVFLAAAAGPSANPARLFEQQRWEDLLAAIRLGLRRSLAEHGGYPESATDREIMRSAGDERIGPAFALFKRVAAAFETAVFARRGVDVAAVTSLYQRYIELADSPPAARHDPDDGGEAA